MAKPDTGIRVKVQPKASRSEILGFIGDVLRVKVAAPPDRGKANAVLLELLATTFGVPKSRITLLRGHASRDKLIVVDGLSQDELQRRLGRE